MNNDENSALEFFPHSYHKLRLEAKIEDVGAMHSRRERLRERKLTAIRS